MGAWKRLFARAKLLSLTLFQTPVISRERLGLAVALGVAQAGWWSGSIDLENFLMLSFISFLWLFIQGILRDRFLFTRYCQSSGCYIFCIFFFIGFALGITKLLAPNEFQKRQSTGTCLLSPHGNRLYPSEKHSSISTFYKYILMYHIPLPYPSTPPTTQLKKFTHPCPQTT